MYPPMTILENTLLLQTAIVSIMADKGMEDVLQVYSFRHHIALGVLHLNHIIAVIPLLPSVVLQLLPQSDGIVDLGDLAEEVGVRRDTKTLQPENVQRF